jgi:uncharacterized RDD family membrane protein YckC
VGAALLDGLILLIPTIILIAIVGAVASTGSEGGIIATALIGALAYLVIALLYAPILMARSGGKNGQTIGKQVTNCRVVRVNGQPFTFGSAAVRDVAVKGFLFGGIGQFFLFIPTLLNVLWPLWDDENRALHDLVVSSRVVRE